VHGPGTINFTPDESSYTDLNRITHFILMEQAHNGDLFDYSLGVKSAMGENLARHFFKQILDAVDYLHSKAKVVHRDLKLENILLDKNFEIKLCDFTLSKTLAEGSMIGVFYTNAGTELYMAPEVHEGKPYRGVAADIFALGVTLFALVTGVMPFEKRAEKDDMLYSFIYRGEWDSYWECLSKMYNGEKQFN